MKTGRFATHFGYPVIGLLALMSGWPPHALAQNDRTHTLTSHHEPSLSHRNDAAAFVKLVRESTERFRDVSVVSCDGFNPQNP